MNEKKILVVDDEEMIRDILEQAFSKAGYEVRTAENAEKAMDVLRQESIMVMFLDLKLPGMNGVDLCKQIRKETKVAIIYALTGHTDLFGLLEVRGAGFDDFFAKPFSIEVLLEAVQEGFKKIERWKIGEYKLA
ncbi:response regulator [Thermodesulfobacteriota bacterium]